MASRSNCSLVFITSFGTFQVLLEPGEYYSGPTGRVS